MSEDAIEIPIEAVDQFSQVFNDADEDIAGIGQAAKQSAYIQVQAAKKSELSWTELRSAYSTLLDVVRVGQQIWDGTVGELDRYAAQVEKVSRLTGMSATESSKLIQVSDDLQISYESLSQALTIAAKKQDLSIDSIAALSDQYLSFGTAQERADFAAKNFGKSYTEVIKLLEAGGETIKAMGAATPEGLIIDEKQIAQVKAYRREIDAWQDSMEALKITIGGELVSAFNESSIRTKIANDLWKEGNYELQNKVRNNLELTASEQEVYDALRQTAEAQYYQTENMDAATEAAAALQESLEATSQANQDMFASMNDFQSIADGYVEKQKDIQASTDELNAKKATLVAQGYGPESQAIADVNAKLDENNAKMAENAAAAEEAAKRKIVAQLEAKLAGGPEGLTDQEFNALLALQQQWGLLSAETVTATKDINAAVKQYMETGDIDSFTGSIDKATEALLNLPDKKDVQLNLITTVNGEETSAANFQNILAATATPE